MAANTHPKTQIAYGVIDANKLSYIMEDIFTNGKNVSFEAQKEDFKNQIATVIKEILIEYKERFTEEFKELIQKEIKDRFISAIDERHYQSDTLIDDIDIDELFADLQKANSINDIDIDAIVDVIENAGLYDYSESDEQNYVYEFDDQNGKIKLELTWLGGSPTIYIVESPYTANCKWCSPCCPNAGDLNNPEPNGITAYCLSQEDMPKDWEGTVELLDEELLALHNSDD